jgi:hypothetical protein
MPFHSTRQLIALIALAGVFGGTAPAQNADDDLRVIVVEGEGFVNNIRHRTARDPVVEVHDRNRRPVAGALVIFTAPQSGPGAVFNGAQTLTVTTDSAGRAVAAGFQPNSTVGEFQIQVEAKFEGRTGRAVIHQRNVSKAKFWNWKTITIVAAIIAGVTIGLVVSRSGGNNGVGISVGPPVVGPR